MQRWLGDIAIFPTLTDDDLRVGGALKIDDDDVDGPMPAMKRQRARPRLGEAVCAAAIYGRARRARLKAAKQASDAMLMSPEAPDDRQFPDEASAEIADASATTGFTTIGAYAKITSKAAATPSRFTFSHLRRKLN
jgi:hypothetical protein